MDQPKNPQILRKLELQLNSLNRSELLAVNKMIVHRIRIMDDLKRLAQNAMFMPGQKVSWKDHAEMTRYGVIIRINKKTITVEEDGDLEGTWKVSASLLTLIS
jgi:hypothetical protein